MNPRSRPVHRLGAATLWVVLATVAFAGSSPAADGLRQRLEDQVRRDQATHRLLLRNGRQIEGQLLDQNEQRLRLRQGFGYSGSIVASYPRATVDRLVSLARPPVVVTDADLALCAEFPAYHFVKQPPYSLVTDEPYDRVERTMGLLRRLGDEFAREFASLLRPDPSAPGIQIVFCGREADFRRYARRVAPGLVNSAGFYCAPENRLVLLNQLGSAHYEQTQERLRPPQADDWRYAAPGGRERLAAARSRVTAEARAMTERLVRHEGAHQLLARQGIPSRRGLEPTWLTEGLALYCETEPIGRHHPALARILAMRRRSGHPIPLRTLLNHRHPDGFLALGEPAETAYAQSWALTSALLQGRYRDRLLALVRFYRDVGTESVASAVQRTEPAELLCDHLGLDWATLEAEYERFLNRL
ncbi:DUF1570 domain-containing protein [bacterium]|nr:DUF1570 domain-containing protein [bacterium]